MSVAKQLYQLQEIDLEIEAKEQTLKQVVSQLGESEAVVKARDRLKVEQEHLEELKKRQHSAEWEIEDLSSKVSKLEETLYSGRITNPKELTSLQHEVNELKARRSQLEDKTLEVMDQIEHTTASAANTTNELKTLEADWSSQQQQLSAEAEQLKTIISDLEQKWQQLSAKIDPPAIELYSELKKQKGTAVAKVEQGICRGCHISLPTTELQRARSGSLMQCSSCSRILFLA